MTKAKAIKQLTLILACAALLPVPAALASGEEVRQDCGEDDSLDGKYTRAELQDGLNNLGGDLDEYSSCRSEINAALHALSATASGSRNDGPGGGPASKGGTRQLAQQREEREEQREKRQLEKVAAALDPTKPATIKAASAANGLPLPLLLVLIGLASLGIAGTVFAARRNPALAKALRSVSLPKLRR